MSDQVRIPEPTVQVAIQPAQIQFEDLQEIEDTDIVNVNSYFESSDRQFLLICSQNGIYILHNPKFTYKCFINKNGPFWIQSYNMSQIGVKIGSLVQSRNQAALVPNFTNKYFSETHVYIFDYEMQCILHKIDFFLKIDNIHITSSQLYVSNKKRLVIYNYLNDTKQKNHKYYLDQYQSKQPNNSLRYLQTFCEQYEDPFTINQVMKQKIGNCLCGKFYMSNQKPRLIAYLQTFNEESKRKICLYDENNQMKKYFEQSLNLDTYFSMALSSDGQFLAYTFYDGTNVNVYNLKENCLQCVLKVSRKVRDILKMEFFTAVIQGKQQLCLSLMRHTNVQTGTLHIFLIEKKSPTEALESKFRRYFPTYENLMQVVGISKTLISPGIFLSGNVLYLYSISGRVFKAIDFNRTGNLVERTFDPNVFDHRWICESEIQA